MLIKRTEPRNRVAGRSLTYNCLPFIHCDLQSCFIDTYTTFFFIETPTEQYCNKNTHLTPVIHLLLNNLNNSLLKENLLSVTFKVIYDKKK